ncbi:MAG: hypothetical protein ACKOX6_00885 [Bdellovibrio sp.]
MPHTVQAGSGEVIPERRNGVVFSKDISLGNVITVLAMLVSVVLGYGRLETRITVLEAAELVREKNAAVENASRLQYQSELKQDLREIRQDLKGLNTAVQNAGIAVKRKEERE